VTILTKHFYMMDYFDQRSVLSGHYFGISMHSGLSSLLVTNSATKMNIT